MTRATWDRLSRLMDYSMDLEESKEYEKAERLDTSINEILLKAGIDQYPPDWDLIDISPQEATIKIFNTEGKLIRYYNVLEARPSAA